MLSPKEYGDRNGDSCRRGFEAPHQSPQLPFRKGGIVMQGWQPCHDLVS